MSEDRTSHAELNNRIDALVDRLRRRIESIDRGSTQNGSNSKRFSNFPYKIDFHLGRTLNNQPLRELSDNELANYAQDMLMRAVDIGEAENGIHNLDELERGAGPSPSAGQPAAIVVDANNGNQSVIRPIDLTTQVPPQSAAQRIEPRQPPTLVQNSTHLLPETIELTIETSQDAIPEAPCDVIYSDRAINISLEVVENLLCTLCIGLVRDARRFDVCGHLFCFRCIADYLQANYSDGQKCPNCRVPDQGLKFDFLANNVMSNLKVIIFNT